MLDKADLEQNLRLSPRAPKPDPDTLLKELNTLLAQQAAPDAPPLNVAESITLILSALREILVQLRMGQIPAIEYNIDEAWLETFGDHAKNDAELHK